MEDPDVFELCCVLQSRNLFSSFVFARITARSQHACDRSARIPFKCTCVDLSINRCFQQRQQIRFHPWQQRLRLRVTETAVKLQYMRTFAGNHQAGIKKSVKLDSLLQETVQQRPHNFRLELSLRFTVPIVCRTESAHPARVWPLVAV